jgi:penicillin amidase
MPAALSPEQRSAVLALLRGEQTAEQLCAAWSINRETLYAWRTAYVQRKLPLRSGRVTAPVQAQVEIIRDRWGIPHIFAERAWDLFFGYGFAVAQDRLWQIDYRRRAAYGMLSEVLGRAGLAEDRRSRILGFRQIAAREWEVISAEAREALEGYAAGVNAAIAHFGDELPLEFDILDYQPQPWTPLDTLTISRWYMWQFSGRIEGIVLAEAALRYLPPELAELYLSLEHGDVYIVPAEEHLARLAAEPLVERPAGSNQWAIGPAKSASGSAILASDGHVPFTQPSTRYEVHLCGAGYDCIGIATPGELPLGNGRNRYISWGLTNNVSSVRDLYIEEVHPEDPSRYREGDAWLPFEVREEIIHVRGEEPVRLMVRSTVRGPIVNDLLPSVDPAGDPPLSLRWVCQEPSDPLSVSLRAMRARSVEEFRALQADWPGGGQNPGFADSAGHIGYQMRGRIPIRGRITRGYRRANDPADRWQGFIPFHLLPGHVDPPRGWIGSANNPPAPSTPQAPLYGAYADGYRMLRIHHWLDQPRRYTRDDMAAMQMDDYSGRAAEVCPALVTVLQPASGRLAQALDLLRRWDYRFSLDSVAASIFQVFWLRWTRRVAAARFPAHLAGLAAGGANFVAHSLLTDGDRRGWFDGRSVQDEARQALEEALDWLEQRLGPDMSRWTWGELHPITLRHPLSSRSPELAAVLDIGPAPCPGSTGCLNQNGFAERERLETVSGPHYRFLADMAEPDRAWGVNTAGNSGHPASPHYADQFQDWLAGRHHPLLMDRDDILAEAEGVLILAPGG